MLESRYIRIIADIFRVALIYLQNRRYKLHLLTTLPFPIPQKQKRYHHKVIPFLLLHRFRIPLMLLFNEYNT
ncbi:hypothetical protein D7H67_22020 [Bacillus sp. S66]|nr:hypothetical protein D7H67_22020 [Bacillus sp. S66]TKI09150.1 hypothetical protein FC691_15955 [Bacillus cereus]